MYIHKSLFIYIIVSLLQQRSASIFRAEYLVPLRALLKSVTYLPSSSSVTLEAIDIYLSGLERVSLQCFFFSLLFDNIDNKDFHTFFKEQSLKNMLLKIRFILILHIVPVKSPFFQRRLLDSDIYLYILFYFCLTFKYFSLFI